MRTLFLHAAMAAALTILPPIPGAGAQERPLIWEFTRNAPAAYTARLGSRLPIGADAGMGAEIGVRGPDLMASRQPVTWWAMLKTEGTELRGTTRTTRIDLRASKLSGRRTLSVNNVLAGRLGALDTQFVHNLALDHNPAGSERVDIRTTRSIRLSSLRTGGVLVARASRTAQTQWVTSIGVEQPFRDAVRFSATVEHPGPNDWRGRLGASYSRRW
jgi:hypothetical protein